MRQEQNLTGASVTETIAKEDDRRFYRVMIPGDDGLPKIGRSASTLGVRVEGRDRRPDIAPKHGRVKPGCGGMSVTPDDWHGIYFAFLENAIDDGEPDEVWCLQHGSLGVDLMFRADPAKPDTHGFIEPAREMSLEEYESALEATRPHWRLYSIGEQA
jgi:hypothetical protein